MFEVVGNLKFRLSCGIACYAVCLETGRVYGLKEANKYYKMYKGM